MSATATAETSGRAGVIPSPGPAEEAAPSRTRARRSGSITARQEQLRALTERLCRERHPDAELIYVNPAHIDGPIAEVYFRDRPTECYRLVGYDD